MNLLAANNRLVKVSQKILNLAKQLLGQKVVRWIVMTAIFTDAFTLSVYVFHGPISLTLSGYPLFRMSLPWRPLLLFIFLLQILFLLIVRQADLQRGERLLRGAYLAFALHCVLFVLTLLGAGIPPAWFGAALTYENHLSGATVIFAYSYAIFLATMLIARRGIFSLQTRSAAFALWAVFFPCFLLYLSNGYAIYGGDTFYNVLLPGYLLQGGKFPFPKSFVAEFGKWGLLPVRDGYAPVWPIGTALFALPGAALQHLLGVPHNIITAGWNQKVTCAWTAALSAAVFFLILLRVNFSSRLRVLLMVVFVLGSPQVFVSAAMLWQHGPAVLLITLGMWCLIRGAEGNDRWFGISGLVLSLLPAVRLQAVVFYLAGVFAVLAMRRKAVWCYVLWSLPFALLLLSFNFMVFHNIFGGYGQHVAAQKFRGSLVEGFGGLLFSPNRGLFIFCPFFLFALPGVFAGMKRYMALKVSFSIAALSYLLIHAQWVDWIGGWCIGPRFLTELTPIIVFLGGSFLSTVTSRFVKRLAVLFAMCSVLVSSLSGWHAAEAHQWNIFPDIDKHRERVWEFSDWQVTRFLEKRKLQAFKEAPAYAFVQNERVLASPGREDKYRVYAGVKHGKKRLFRLGEIYLKRGEYELVIRGETATSAGLHFSLRTEYVNDRFVDASLSPPAKGIFTLSYPLSVQRQGFVNLDLSIDGHGKVFFDSFKLRPH